MPLLLFKLRNVPDDEADEIRQLLRDREIDFYETSAGNWGIAMPAIWLREEAQMKQATSLITAYQLERQRRAIETCNQLRQQGKQRTVIDKIGEAPLRALLYLAAVLFILFISTMPFLNLFR